LTTLNNISLLAVQHQGEVNVSLFAVGDCCGCPTKGAAAISKVTGPAHRVKSD